MKDYLLFLTVAGLFSTGCLAAEGDSLWSHTYGGEGVDAAYSAIQTSDGGFMLVGSTLSFGAGITDLWMVKTDGQGDSLWSRTYGGSSWDGGYSAIQTPDEGYVLAGWTQSYGAGGKDWWLLKTDAQGDCLWSNTFGGAADDYAYSVIQTVDGGFLLTGWTWSSGGGAPYFKIIKTNEMGVSSWQQIYTSAGGWGYAVLQTSDEGYLVAGRSFASAPGNENMKLLRVNPEGNLIWSRLFGGRLNDFAYDVMQTSTERYLAVGQTYSFGAGNRDVYAALTNVRGDLLWSRTYGGVNEEWAAAVTESAEGGFLLAGATSSAGAGYYDFWLVKTAANGDSLWSRTFGGVSQDWATCVIPTAEGNYVLAGATSSFGAGYEDFWLVAVEGLPTAVPPAKPSAPLIFTLQPPYPNPFNPTTTIRYQIPDARQVNLRVYDTAGRLVANLVEAYQDAGDYEVTFDASKLASGIYLYRMEARKGAYAPNDFTASGKMVLLK